MRHGGAIQGPPRAPFKAPTSTSSLGERMVMLPQLERMRVSFDTPHRIKCRAAACIRTWIRITMVVRARHAATITRALRAFAARRLIARLGRTHEKYVASLTLARAWRSVAVRRRVARLGRTYQSHAAARRIQPWFRVCRKREALRGLLTIERAAGGIGLLCQTAAEMLRHVARTEARGGGVGMSSGAVAKLTAFDAASSMEIPAKTLSTEHTGGAISGVVSKGAALRPTILAGGTAAVQAAMAHKPSVQQVQLHAYQQSLVSQPLSAGQSARRGRKMAPVAMHRAPNAPARRPLATKSPPTSMHTAPMALAHMYDVAREKDVTQVPASPASSSPFNFGKKPGGGVAEQPVPATTSSPFSFGKKPGVAKSTGAFSFTSHAKPATVSSAEATTDVDAIATTTSFSFGKKPGVAAFVASCTDAAATPADRTCTFDDGALAGWMPNEAAVFVCTIVTKTLALWEPPSPDSHGGVDGEAGLRELATVLLVCCPRVACIGRTLVQLLRIQKLFPECPILPIPASLALGGPPGESGTGDTAILTPGFGKSNEISAIGKREGGFAGIGSSSFAFAPKAPPAAAGSAFTKPVNDHAQRVAQQQQSVEQKQGSLQTDTKDAISKRKTVKAKRRVGAQGASVGGVVFTAPPSGLSSGVGGESKASIASPAVHVLGTGLRPPSGACVAESSPASRASNASPASRTKELERAMPPKTTDQHLTFAIRAVCGSSSEIDPHTLGYLVSVLEVLAKEWHRCDTDHHRRVSSTKAKNAAAALVEPRPVTCVHRPPSCVLAGATGANSAKVNGIYHPVDEVYNEMVLYRKEGDDGKWLRYVAGTSNHWKVSSTADKDANNNTAWAYCVEKGLADPSNAATWHVLNHASFHASKWEVQSVKCTLRPPSSVVTLRSLLPVATCTAGLVPPRSGSLTPQQPESNPPYFT